MLLVGNVNLLVGNGFVINPGGMINTDSGIPRRAKKDCVYCSGIFSARVGFNQRS